MSLDSVKQESLKKIITAALGEEAKSTEINEMILDLLYFDNCSFEDFKEILSAANFETSISKLKALELFLQSPNGICVREDFISILSSAIDEETLVDHNPNLNLSLQQVTDEFFKKNDSPKNSGSLNQLLDLITIEGEKADILKHSVITSFLSKDFTEEADFIDILSHANFQEKDKYCSYSILNRVSTYSLGSCSAQEFLNITEKFLSYNEKRSAAALEFFENKFNSCDLAEFRKILESSSPTTHTETCMRISFLKNFNDSLKQEDIELLLSEECDWSVETIKSYTEMAATLIEKQNPKDSESLIKLIKSFDKAFSEDPQQIANLLQQDQEPKISAITAENLVSFTLALYSENTNLQKILLDYLIDNNFITKVNLTKLQLDDLGYEVISGFLQNVAFKLDLSELEKLQACKNGFFKYESLATVFDGKTVAKCLTPKAITSLANSFGKEISEVEKLRIKEIASYYDIHLQLSDLREMLNENFANEITNGFCPSSEQLIYSPSELTKFNELTSKKVEDSTLIPIKTLCQLFSSSEIKTLVTEETEDFKINFVNSLITQEDQIALPISNSLSEEKEVLHQALNHAISKILSDLREEDVINSSSNRLINENITDEYFLSPPALFNLIKSYFSSENKQTNSLMRKMLTNLGYNAEDVFEALSNSDDENSAAELAAYLVIKTTLPSEVEKLSNSANFESFLERTKQNELLTSSNSITLPANEYFGESSTDEVVAATPSSTPKLEPTITLQKDEFLRTIKKFLDLKMRTNYSRILPTKSLEGILMDALKPEEQENPTVRKLNLKSEAETITLDSKKVLEIREILRKEFPSKSLEINEIKLDTFKDQSRRKEDCMHY